RSPLITATACASRLRTREICTPWAGSSITPCGGEKYLARLSNDRACRTAFRFHVARPWTRCAVGSVASFGRGEHGELGVRLGRGWLCPSASPFGRIYGGPALWAPCRGCARPGSAC